MYVLLDRRPPKTRDAVEWVARQLAQSQGECEGARNSLASSRFLVYGFPPWPPSLCVHAGRMRNGKKQPMGSDQQSTEYDLAVVMGVIRAEKFGTSKGEYKLDIHPQPMKPNWVDPAQAMAGWAPADIESVCFA